MRFAERMGRLTTAASFDMLARGKAFEAQGRSIIHLGIGEPDFDTPAYIREAANAALAAGYTHYGPAAGLPEFRSLIATTWRLRRGLRCEAANVVVTPGAKPILFFAMLALLEAGDEVLIPSPAFPNYVSIAEFLGARVVPVPLLSAHGFDVDLAALRDRITPRSRMLLLNSPHNPTGSVLPGATLMAIAELACRHDLVVLSDEIYSGMVYEGESPSIATLPGMSERTVVVDGFSKTYAMTGWRMGHAILPVDLVEPFVRLVINSVSGTSAHQQIAAAEALDGPQDAVDEMVEEFRSRRDLIVDGLNAIAGVRCLRPKGAFYVFPDISGTGLTGPEAADRLLNEAGVSVLSGTAFGKVGANHLRISYANSRANITAALERMRAVFEPARESGRLASHRTSSSRS